jgi:hypothetical protein
VGRHPEVLRDDPPIDPIEEFDRTYEWSAALYRAIGRFIVQFEWLCEAMRREIGYMVWLDPTTAPSMVLNNLG